MMDFPLTLTHILERSAQLYASQEIVSRMPDSMHRYTYSAFHSRVHRLAAVLDRLGVRPGERVGTLCWNSYRHLELYWAVPCYGAVLHTLNLRLSSDQLAYIINHAEDRVIFVDASLASVLRPILGQIHHVRRIIVMPDEPWDEGSLPGAENYEDLIASMSDARYEWPHLNELAAAATCYTSGTTGNPKGVLYSHRALVLHTFALAFADAFAISERDTVLQLVPMFHANGWGIPYTALMTGARIVFTGRSVQPGDLVSLIEGERVTFTAGVPTIWMQLNGFLQKEHHDLSSLRLVICAGSAMPRQLLETFAKKHNVKFMLAWGMTETTPIATLMAVKSGLDNLPDDERFDLLTRHGLALPGVDIRIVDERGLPLPWDGSTMGELQVRGLWVTSGYYKDPRGSIEENQESFMDGWFRTGDVATIDVNGYIQIMDRTKDLVKSGGEWISSVDLENAIMGHPKVLEAAVIAAYHPKWDERPLACVVAHAGYRDKITKTEILEFLATRVAKWWLPDEVLFIEAVPKTSVGKFNKRALREQLKDYVLPPS